jgi:hypothetical protein
LASRACHRSISGRRIDSLLAERERSFAAEAPGAVVSAYLFGSEAEATTAARGSRVWRASLAT